MKTCAGLHKKIIRSISIRKSSDMENMLAGSHPKQACIEEAEDSSDPEF